ncbi:MAG: hypothetical protein ACLFPU_11090 [Dehalococcoidia bacterium]
MIRRRKHDRQLRKNEDEEQEVKETYKGYDGKFYTRKKKDKRPYKRIKSVPRDEYILSR